MRILMKRYIKRLHSTLNPDLTWLRFNFSQSLYLKVANVSSPDIANNTPMDGISNVAILKQ